MESKKRKLSDKELDDTLSFIKINKFIPIEISLCNVERVKLNLKEQFKNVELYPEIIPKLKDELEKAYYKALIQAGEMVGVLSATYQAEIITQLTLNAFHFAGLSSFSVSLGVPRLQELLNASRNIKQPSMTLYLKDEKEFSEKYYRLYKEIEEVELFDLLDKRYLINGNEKITEFKLQKPEISYYRKLTDEENQWYEFYYELYDDTVKIEKYPWSLRLVFDKDKLYEKNITLLEIVKKIEIFRDLYCVSSPDVIGIIDVYVDTSQTELSTDSSWIDEENKSLIFIETIVVNYLMELLVKGVDGIKTVYFNKQEDNKWIKETDGSNLSELFKYDQFDHTKTLTNDIWEIYRIFGIEATRAVLLIEFRKIISFGGFILNCHIENLVNAMTNSGKITSVSRHGNDKDAGPLTIASFEEAFKCIVNAGVKNSIEDIDGVSASVITGQFSKIGSGTFDVLYKPKITKKSDNLANCLERDEDVENKYSKVPFKKVRFGRMIKGDQRSPIKKSPIILRSKERKRSNEKDIRVDLSDDDETLSPARSESSPVIVKKIKGKSYSEDETIGDSVIELE
jgi:DNA-directed RNA polymerase II subunit RPB1